MIAHLGGKRSSGGQCLTLGHHLLDEPEGLCLLGANPLAAENHALGPALAHQLSQPLGTTGAGQQSHARLR